MPPLPECRVITLGTVDYRDARDIQVDLAAEVRENRIPNTLLLLEHPHVYTHGRLSKPWHFLLDPGELSAQGVGVYETDRGGLVTYHGPGQLVAYPILMLREWGGPVKYVRTLEQVIIDALADFGIAGNTINGITGVWAGGGKIASIGVKVSRGVSHHGLALNVNTDLSYFGHIIPCGLHDVEVTSMACLLGQDVDIEMAEYSLAYHFGKQMGFRMVEGDLPAIPSSTGQVALEPSDIHPDS